MVRKQVVARDPIVEVFKHLKLRHLTCALEVARLGSLRAVADSFHITESAVSKTIRELETHLGTRLFERSKHGMALTDSGREFASYAEGAIRTLQLGVANATGGRLTRTPRIRIGAMAVVSATFLPEVIHRFTSAHGACLIEIVGGPGDELLAGVRAGDIDILLGRCPPTSEMSGMKFEQLYTDRHIFVARKGHPLAGERPVSASAIAAFPIVVPPRQSLFWPEIHQLFMARGISPSSTQVEVLDLQFCRTYTFKSDAIWIASERVVTADLYSGALVRLAVDLPAFDVPVGLITPRAGTPGPLIRQLVQLVKQASA